jgi:hypothetical protein
LSAFSEALEWSATHMAAWVGGSRWLFDARFYLDRGCIAQPCAFAVARR